MSSTSPMRPTAVEWPIASRCSLVRTATTRSVAVVPGAIAFAVAPWGPSSKARTRVSECTPALAAAYGGDVPGRKVSPAMEPTFTMRPLRWRLKAGMAARQQRNALFRLRSTTMSHSSTGVSSTDSCFQKPPAQLTSTSSRPASARTRSKTWPTWAASVTSQARNAPCPPRSRMAWAVVSPFSRSRSTTKTRAPAAANPSAAPLPIPRRRRSPPPPGQRSRMPPAPFTLLSDSP